MPNLVQSHAILALEAMGYEQASGKPNSFGKVIGSVTATCRLTNNDSVITGSFTLQLNHESGLFQGNSIVPVMIESDINRGEQLAFQDLTNHVQNMWDNAKSRWERLDRAFNGAATLIRIEGDEKKRDR